MTQSEKTATVEDLISWNPCWSEEKIRTLAGDKEVWTVEDVVGLRGSAGLSDEDWEWLLLRYLCETGRLGRVVWWACDCADSTNTDVSSVTDVVRDFVKGKASRGRLEAARSAASSAASSAAWDSARAAARSAARAAARAAAWAAARAAACSAARNAAWAAARNAARNAAQNAAWAAAWDAARAAARAAARDNLARLALTHSLEEAIA